MKNKPAEHQNNQVSTTGDEGNRDTVFHIVDMVKQRIGQAVSGAWLCRTEGIQLISREGRLRKKATTHEQRKRQDGDGNQQMRRKQQIRMQQIRSITTREQQAMVTLAKMVKKNLLFSNTSLCCVRKPPVV